MGPLAQKGIQAWSALNQAKSLPANLQLEPSQILLSPELQQAAIEAYDEYQVVMSKRETWRAEQEKFQALIKSAILNTEDELKALLPCSFWVSSIGACPAHLFLVTKTEADAAKLISEDYLQLVMNKLHRALQDVGYPVSHLDDRWFSIYSDELCQREANGNWYHFFK